MDELSPDALRADLLERWRAAFDRRTEAESIPAEAVETVYTEYPAFALEGYTPKRFKPGARVHRERKSASDYAFELDAGKRPVRVRFEHRDNGVAWRGFFRYAPDEVEQVEHCVQTGVPSLVNRLILDAASPTPGVLAEQRFVCNRGGYDPAWIDLAPELQAERILSDPTDYFVYITRYELEDGLPVAAEELHEVGGQIHRPTREYGYEDGKLCRIVQVWPDGERRTLYARKTKKKQPDERAPKKKKK